MRLHAFRLLLTLGIVAIYAVCYVAIKAGLSYTPPLLFAGLRTEIAGVVLLLMVLALRRPLLLDRRGWGWLLALALTAITLSYGAMFLAPGRTGAGIASVLGNTQPLIAVALAAGFLGERLTRGTLAALALGIAGVTLIASGALNGDGAAGLTGPALALGASAGAAVSSVIVKRMGMRADLLTVSAWQLVIGGLPLLGASALTERDSAVIWNAQFVALLLFLALVGTALAIPTWYWLVQREPIGRLMLFLFLVPVIGLALATAAFGERVSLAEAAGVVLALTGVWVASRRSADETGSGTLSGVTSGPQPGRRA